MSSPPVLSENKIGKQVIRLFFVLIFSISISALVGEKKIHCKLLWKILSNVKIISEWNNEDTFSREKCMENWILLFLFVCLFGQNHHHYYRHLALMVDNFCKGKFIPNCTNMKCHLFIIGLFLSFFLNRSDVAAGIGTKSQNPKM